MARAEQDVGLVADAVTGTPLAVKGALLLRDATAELADRVAWGNVSPQLAAGTPLPAPADGASMERLPGGAQGNMRQSGDNAADFALRAAPVPQNTGSGLTPEPAQLALSCSFSRSAVANPHSTASFPVGAVPCGCPLVAARSRQPYALITFRAS